MFSSMATWATVKVPPRSRASLKICTGSRGSMGTGGSIGGRAHGLAKRERPGLRRAHQAMPKNTAPMKRASNPMGKMGLIKTIVETVPRAIAL
jgi:hypothetical protein